jgi:hypothetical protein
LWRRHFFAAHASWAAPEHCGNFRSNHFKFPIKAKTHDLRFSRGESVN